jgi:hypothetical protein
MSGQAPSLNSAIPPLSSISRALIFPDFSQISIVLNASFTRWAISCQAFITVSDEATKKFKATALDLFAEMPITDSDLFAQFKRCPVAPHALHISQQLPKKRMPAKRG